MNTHPSIRTRDVEVHVDTVCFYRGVRLRVTVEIAHFPSLPISTDVARLSRAGYPLPRGRRDGRVRSLSCCGGGGSGNELLPAIRPNQPRRVMWTPSKKRSWCARDRVMCATSQSHSRRIVDCILDMDIPAVLQRYSAAG